MFYTYNHIIQLNIKFKTVCVFQCFCTENENCTKCQSSKAEIITQFSLKTITLFSRLSHLFNLLSEAAQRDNICYTTLRIMGITTIR